MKKGKTYASPVQILGTMFLSGGLSLLYLSNMLLFDKNKDEAVIAIVLTAMALALFGASIFFNVKIIANKSLRKGDEFTESILGKAGYMCFVIFVVLIMLLFVALHLFVLVNSDFEGQLKDLLNIKMIIAAVAGTQIFVTFLFTLLVYVFGKKGNVNEF